MARRMACTAELVGAWENGKESPDHDALNQMQYLQSFVASNSERILKTPLAEQVMRDDQLCQLTHRDLLDRTFKV